MISYEVFVVSMAMLGALAVFAAGFAISYLNDKLHDRRIRRNREAMIQPDVPWERE